MRFFIDRAYASAPAKDKILCTNSPELLEKLKALGLKDRKDQALHVLVGYDLIELEPLPMSVTSRIVLTANGKAYFEKRRDHFAERRWTRGLAIAAIIISLFALILELDDRGFLGGFLDRFKTTQTSTPFEAPARPDQSQSR